MRTIIAAVAGLLVTAGAAWADDLTGPVTAISGRTITIKNVVFTFPPAPPGQPDMMADIHRGETWSVSYTPGPTNSVTKAVKEPEYGNND